MYLRFFGLREMPFNITPDPRFLYFAAHHREAFDHLIYGIETRKGFIELTGEVGCGKTTICRAALNSLIKNIQTALILNPSLNENQLLRAILGDFGVEVRAYDRLTYIEQLNEFLLEESGKGNNVALLIDEAQNLSPEVMEQIRLLSNLETDQHKLIQIVLCGQPELQDRLNRPELRQLKQRITVRCRLYPLNEPEIGEYIRHRLHVAGADGGIRFDKEALRRVFKYTRGTPRLINAVCDNAMIAGYVEGKRTIDAQCVKRAVRQLEGR